jgi:hypothetical protein
MFQGNDPKDNQNRHKAFSDAVKEAYKKYGVTVAFLLATPRVKRDDQSMMWFTRSFINEAHMPFVAGIDLLGHEKTSNKDYSYIFAAAANMCAKNGWKHFTIRSHAGESDEHKDNIKVGDTVQIRLNYGNTEKTKAEIVSIKDEGEGKTIVLKITKNVEDLINYRKISFDIIWWEEQGLKIPNAAVVGQGNNATVTLLKYGLEYTVRVKIQAQNDDYSIITDLSSSDLEELNLSSADVKRSISIYDELVIK